MKKLLLSLLVLFTSSQGAWASAPLRRTFAVGQSDSTEVLVKRVGNEHFSFYATTDGWALLRNANGDLCYAKQVGSIYEPSTVMAHNEEARSAEEKVFVSSSAVKAVDAFNEVREAEERRESKRMSRVVAAPETTGLGRFGHSAGGSIPSIGNVCIPVIMVEFPDLPFTKASEETLNNQMNKEGYRDANGSVGSLRDYFVDNSYGMFTPEFRIVGRMMAKNNHDYYGAHGENGSNDGKMIDLVVECLNYLGEQGMDAAPFTYNGKIPLLSIYYAGEGEQSAFSENADDYIWAHQAGLLNAEISGTPVNAYLATNELICSYDGTNPVESYLTGIGVYAHEFCHGLGLPDVYDVTYSGITGMDYWSLMDLGEHWNNGYTPIGLTAYERCFLGWLEIPTLTETGDYELQRLTDTEGPRAYRIVSPNQRREYYILENRQIGTKWFPTSMGHGMLVSHIYYDPNAWTSNNVNTNARSPRYTYIPADNALGHIDDYNRLQTAWIKGDLYPGPTQNHELTDESSPAATVYVGRSGEKFMGQPIYDIREKAGVISFTYMDAATVGINNIVLDETVTVYTLDGRKLFEAPNESEAQTRLTRGLYLLKSARGTKKLYVD